MELETFAEGSAGAVFVPAAGRRLGTVVICHERYGLAQHTLDLAERLAGDGYVAIAPDFFADWDGDKEALARGEIMVDLDDETVVRHLSAAIAHATAALGADPSRIGVVGVCLSGSYGLLASMVHPELAAVVVLYGGAGDKDVTPDRPLPYAEILPKLKAPVLGIWGEDDHVVSIPQIRRLRNLLEEHDATYEFTLFPGMPHGWLNSTMPGRYRPQAAERAWGLVTDFLARAFGGELPPARRRWTFSCDSDLAYDFTKKVRLA